MEPPSFFNITSITLLWEWSDSNFSQTTSIFLNVLGMSRISYHLKGCRGGYGVCFHYGVAWLSPSYMSVSNPGKAGNVVWKMCAVMCMWKCVGECVCVYIYREMPTMKGPCKARGPRPLATTSYCFVPHWLGFHYHSGRNNKGLMWMCGLPTQQRPGRPRTDWTELVKPCVCVCVCALVKY